MFKTGLLFFLIFSWQSYAHAQTWETIYPVVHCPQLPIQYQKQQAGHYQLKITVDDKEEFHSIQDINNLLSITDRLNEISDKICPTSTLTATCDNGQFFSEDYIEFINFTADYVNQNKDQCANIIPYIKLQDEISQLEQVDLIKFRPSRKIGHVLLKLLTNTETDQMINQFQACGGKKGSDQFIKNMILLEAKKSCTVPSQLSWDEAEEIASSIAREYKDINLLQINKNQKKLAYDATIAFTNKVLEKEVSKLLGPYIPDTQSFIKGLDSYKRLMNRSSQDDLGDYVSYVFSPDVTLEIAEKTIPIFIENSFKQKLPAAWPDEKKEEYMQQVLLKESQDKYQNCMKDRIKSSKYKQSIPKKDMLNHRLGIKETFCTQYPAQCQNDCQGSINILEMSDRARDSEIISACVMQSIATAVNPLIKAIIYYQKEEFKDSFTLTDEMAETFSNQTWDTIVNCTNRSIRSRFNIDEPIDIIKDETPLQKISPIEFEGIILRCADYAEAKVSGEFVTQLLLHEPTIQETFNQGPLVNNFGSQFHQATIDAAKQIHDNSYRKCMRKQYQLFQAAPSTHGIDQKNAMLCTPSIEMNAAFLVIEQKLKEMAAEQEMSNDPETLAVLTKYQSCGNSAIDASISDLGSLTSRTPINNVEDSKYYLDTNPAFLNCVNEAIGSMGYLIAGKEYNLVIEEQKKIVKDIKFLENQKPLVQQTIQSCLMNGINNSGDYLAERNITHADPSRTGPWSNFMQFNSNGGFEVLQKECELQANQAVIPKLVINEAKLQLQPLVKDGYINNQTQLTSVLRASANDIAKDYNINVPTTVPREEVPEYIFAQALRLHLAQGGTSDSYLNQLTKKIEDKTIQTVHSNLMGQIENKTADPAMRTKLSTFGDYFPVGCLQNIYNRFMKNSTAGDSMSMDELSSYIQSGLVYTENKDPLSFRTELKVIQNECQNFSQFRAEKDFHKSKFYEIILKGEIYNQFKDEFSSEIMSNIDLMEKNLEAPNLALKKKYITYLRNNMQKLIAEKINPKYFEETVFKGGSVIAFAQNNLDGLLKKDKKIMAQLSESILYNLFSDTKSKSFASDFTKLQIVATIGISGVDDAIDQANRKGTFFKLGSWRFGPNNYAKEAANKFFNDPANVEKSLDWDKISERTRGSYIQTINQAAIIGASYKKPYSENTKGSLTNMFRQQALQQIQIPQDTNPTPFERQAESTANMRQYMMMSTMSKQLDDYVKQNGYKNFNKEVERVVSLQVALLQLPETSSNSNLNLLSYGTVIKPSRSETQNMLEDELRSYYLTSTITNGLETYKYSDGKTAIERIEGSISLNTKGALGTDLLIYTRPFILRSF